MNKLSAIWALFQQGRSVANPQAWRTGQITGSIIAGVLATGVTLAKVYGYELPVTDAQLLQIGGGIVGVVGLFVHPAVAVITSVDAGLPPKPQPPATVQNDSWTG